jgi:hypothetical protein
MCTAFDVGQSTASAKAAIIRRLLNPNRFDPTWSLRFRIDENSLVWMLDINGILVDIRDYGDTTVFPSMSLLA